MTLWIGLRLVKFVALVALAAGLGLGVGQRRQLDRLRATAWVATPALWATWLAGYLLLKTTGRSLGTPFVLVAIVASLTALHGAALSAWKPTPRTISRGLGLAGLAAATAVMVVRDAPIGVAACLTVAAAAVGLALAWALPEVDGDSVDVRAETWRWFAAVARAEGLSLVLMMCVSMPLRRATGVSLDGGTGALGWAHGGLVLIYLQALQVTARTLGWSWRTIALAFVASMVPFGTFVFERAQRRPVGVEATP